eukprot:jgi/Chrzof1/1710/Cz10g18060.t1
MCVLMHAEQTHLVVTAGAEADRLTHQRGLLQSPTPATGVTRTPLTGAPIPPPILTTVRPSNNLTCGFWCDTCTWTAIPSGQVCTSNVVIGLEYCTPEGTNNPLSTLFSAISAAGLNSTLTDDNFNATIFAPNNQVVIDRDTSPNVQRSACAVHISFTSH